MRRLLGLRDTNVRYIQTKSQATNVHTYIWIGIFSEVLVTREGLFHPDFNWFCNDCEFAPTRKKVHSVVISFAEHVFVEQHVFEEHLTPVTLWHRTTALCVCRVHL